MRHTIWRLTKAKHRSTALSGYGSLLHAGRWHHRGIPIVYAAENPALALLETLVHVETPDLLAFAYIVVPIRLADEHLATLAEQDLPAGWDAWPYPAATQSLGTEWFTHQTSVVLEVPSAVVPRQRNYLINPQHPRFPELEIGEAEDFPIDSRLAERAP